MAEPGYSAIPDLTDEEWVARLTHTYRYAQVGSCVNSVAHDLNNFLGAIMAYAELIEMDVDLPPEPKRMLDDLLDAVKRSSGLVSSLTGIARGDKIDIGVIELCESARNVFKIRSYDFTSKGYELKLEAPDQPVELVGDRMKIELAIMYLLVNALDALVHGEGKRATMSVRLNGDFAEIAIWNEGEAIPADVVRQMYQPFFTTRASGHLGMGLPAALQIADLHGGTLRYVPEEGFVFSLPKAGRLASATADST